MMLLYRMKVLSNVKNPSDCYTSITQDLTTFDLQLLAVVGEDPSGGLRCSPVQSEPSLHSPVVCLVRVGPRIRPRTSVFLNVFFLLVFL